MPSSEYLLLTNLPDSTAAAIATMVTAISDGVMNRIFTAPPESAMFLLIPDVFHVAVHMAVRHVREAHGSGAAQIGDKTGAVVETSG